ncbi:MAG: hypothetical protein R6V00_07410 [Candidatus Aminicenantes bacterium]
MGLIRFFAVRGYRKELKKFIAILKGIGTPEISNVLIYGMWIRAVLEIDEKLPILKDEDGSINPELHSYPILLKSIQFWVRSFTKHEEHTGKWLGLYIWIHTLRGILRPEIKPLVKQMWDILMESKLYWDKSLKMLKNDDLKIGIDTDMVYKTEQHTKNIISTLPPKQI